jgi:hypothetical protein
LQAERRLLVRNEVIEAAANPTWADRAALDTSPEFERHRRYRSAKTRGLLRMIDTLCKVRKVEIGIENGEDGCQAAEGELQVADEPCELEAGGCDEGQSSEPRANGDGARQNLPGNLTTPQKAPNKANLESTQDTFSQGLESQNGETAGREQSQSRAGRPAVQGGGNERVETIVPVYRRARAAGRLGTAKVLPARSCFAGRRARRTTPAERRDAIQ